MGTVTVLLPRATVLQVGPEPAGAAKVIPHLDTERRLARIQGRAHLQTEKEAVSGHLGADRSQPHLALTPGPLPPTWPGEM